MSFPTFEDIKKELIREFGDEFFDIRELKTWTMIRYSHYEGICTFRSKHTILLLPYRVKGLRYETTLRELRTVNEKDVPLLEKAKELPVNQSLVPLLDAYIKTQQLRMLFR